ncbi:MAG TPA: glycosyl hydrolase [Victivallales bacterium]|nr:glycosyl hydrolase [Victivallales bacterium]HRR28151.1 glycosyl hydrolase [Victivallales bacterium]
MKKIFTIISLALFFLHQIFSAEPIPCGKGSYASEPPEEKEIKKLYSFLPELEPDIAKYPVPTNDWWTTQLTNKFPGKMWALPTVISANSESILIWYPIEWQNNGTEMDLGPALKLLPQDNEKSSDPTPDIIICDFESENWPPGWSVSGNAWGKGPVNNNTARNKANGINGNRYANSYLNAGDQGQGTIISQPFTIQRDYMRLLVGGGSDGGKAKVSLEIEGKEIYSVSGKNSWEHFPVIWDLKKFKNKKAIIKLVDQTGGGWGWISVDQIVQTNYPEKSSGIFSKCSTKDFSDWMQVMRLRKSQDKFIDITYGQGFPFIWIELKKLDLTIPLDTEDKILDTENRKIKSDFNGSALIITRDKRSFVVFSPENTNFQLSPEILKINFKSEKKYLIIALAPDAKIAKTFQKYAYSIPRKTIMSYNYNPTKGLISTKWEIKTEQLNNDTSNNSFLQGWLPHHYRTTKNNLSFTDISYNTNRGKLRIAKGNSFEINWNFNGILPVLPKPTHNEKDYPYDEKRMENYVKKWTDDQCSKPYTGQDTYWGAKDILRISQIMMIARQLNMPEADKLRNKLREILSDWLTYTPGENSRYFAKYPPPWSGLVGIKPSYGSENFTDHHFHYGYFTLSGALLALEDTQWASEFAPMLKLIAKQYANWDRNDPIFPYFRTFNFWRGHSYAGGISNPNDGNNQESSSESMQAWTGLFLLGNALHDDDMISAGAMGWAIESEAIFEYWNDYYAWKLGQEHSNYSANYKNKYSIISVLRDRDIGYWTWFSGEAIHIYGIQWLPLWTSLQYLGKDPQFSERQFENMLNKQGKGQNFPIVKLGDDWGNIALTPLIFGNPRRAAKILDEAYEEKNKFADFKHATLTYYFSHSMLSLGQIEWNYHTSIPTSTVFKNSNGEITAVIYNPGQNEISADIFSGNAKIATTKVSPKVISKYKFNSIQK